MRVKGESFVWALSALAQLNRTPFDAKLILQQFPPPYTSEALHEAASSLGLKVGVKQVQAHELGQLSLPCLAVLKPATCDEKTAPDDPKVTPIAAARGGEATRVDDADAHEIVLIVSANADNVAFFDGTNPTIHTAALPDFAARFAGMAVQFARQPPAVKDQEGGQQAREFGFSWFIPELLKHKHIWRDVLAASLVIQLMALATPLFTQVVIDKVVVHHTVNTETIRQFVSSAAVTLMLDCPFLLIFLGIMLYYNWLLTLVTLGVLLTIVAISFAVTPVFCHLSGR